ncbi:Isochorismatase-like protein [Lipomyces kononenkoae]|uniref:Isochorismatase-like protein n=1 Tax=Lipomyces kononenkoae TaxID=34357 RepID=A0ACC3SYB4_LIPKO
MTVTSPLTISSARPAPFSLPAGRTALIIIDMQRDFVLPTGYGAVQCPSPEVFAQVAKLIGPCLDALRAARHLGMTVVHTREGHVPDLSDCPPTKLDRQLNANKRHVLCIGDEGPMGRLLVRGAYGHDIVDELKPRRDEVVLDKPGKGSFYNTDLHEILVSRGITHLLFCGVTAECCVATTFREANDHGFECCVLTDCTGGFNGTIVSATMDMFCAYDGLLGYASTSKALESIAEAHFANALAQPQPLDVSSNLLLNPLHASYVSGAKSVTQVITGIYDSLDPSDFVSLTPRETALVQAGKLDADKTVDVDGTRDLPLLYGVPFATTPEFSLSATVIAQIVSEGAIYLGTVASPSALLTVQKATYILTTTTDLGSSLPSSLSGYVTTKGSLSTTGITLASPSTSTITILAHSVLDARSLWAILVRIPNPTPEPLFQHFRDRPIISVDYRGFEGGGIRYAVAPSASDAFLSKVEPIFAKTGKLPGRKVPGEEASSALSAAIKLASSPESVMTLEQAPTSSVSALDTISNMHALESAKALFAKAFDSGIDSPDVFVVQLTSKVMTGILALGVCAVVVQGSVAFIGAKGIDARILDVGVLAQI